MAFVGVAGVTATQRGNLRQVCEGVRVLAARVRVFEEDGEFDDAAYVPLAELARAREEEDVEVVQKGTDPDAGGEVLMLGDLDIGTSPEESRTWEHVIDVPARKDGSIFSDHFFEVFLEDHDLMYTLIKDLGKPKPTLVQAAVLPWALDEKDVVICSHTGTGKTLSFLLPTIEQIDEKSNDVQAVIVAPSRELAMQISQECEKLISRMDVRSMPLIGGANPARQIEKLRKSKPHIVIGTPGRLVELLEAGKLRMSTVRHLIVDEVDHCLVEGFSKATRSLLKARSFSCQVIFASATADRVAVRAFAHEWMQEPVLIRVEADRRLPRSLEHHYIVVPKRKRAETLRKLMFIEPTVGSAICFVDNQEKVDSVADKLVNMKMDSVVALRGDADKTERASVMQKFRGGKARLLVATEVAARGLDLPNVSMIVNFDLPTDADHYIHRAGRCGRAGKNGTVVSLVTTDNAFVVTKLEGTIGIKMEHSTVYEGRLLAAEALPEHARVKRTQAPAGDVSKEKAVKEKVVKEKVVKEKEVRNGSGEDADEKPRLATSRTRTAGERSDSKSKAGPATRARTKGADLQAQVDGIEGWDLEELLEFTEDDFANNEEGPGAAQEKKIKKKKLKKMKLKKNKETARSKQFKADLKASPSAGSTEAGKVAGKPSKPSKAEARTVSVSDADDDDDDGGEWVIDGPEKKKKAKPKRREADIKKRAADEKWVGNRG